MYWKKSWIVVVNETHCSLPEFPSTCSGNQMVAHQPWMEGWWECNSPQRDWGYAHHFEWQQHLWSHCKCGSSNHWFHQSPCQENLKTQYSLKLHWEGGTLQHKCQNHTWLICQCPFLPLSSGKGHNHFWLCPLAESKGIEPSIPSKKGQHLSRVPASTSMTPLSLAVGRGFEPLGLLHPSVFKTDALGHSANPLWHCADIA